MSITCTCCEHIMARNEEATFIDGEAHCLDCVAFTEPITDRAGIKSLIENLHRHGWLYHFDDDPRDIENWMHDCGRGADAPTELQLDLIEERVAEARKLDERAVWTFSKFITR
ncbi:MAG: hypothetical protein VX951_08900 [Planctomycetota bacterium]|nr:hypothetical protein [Planctomycetota bacterium]